MGLNSDLWIGYKSYIGSILVHRDCIQVNASWIGYKCHNSRPYNRDRIHCQYELNASVISGLNIGCSNNRSIYGLNASTLQVVVGYKLNTGL